MEMFLLMVFCAFVLFGILLPLLGIVVGLFCYYVLPYAFGVVIAMVMAMIAGINIIFTWWVWLVGLVWATSVHLVRMKFRDLGDDVEHYHAANTTLLAGLPLQRRRSQLSES